MVTLLKINVSTFSRFLLIRSDNVEIHNILDEFESRPDWTTELPALEHLQRILKIGEWCLHLFSVVFLLENYLKHFDGSTCWLSGEQSLPFGLLVLDMFYYV